MLSSSSSNHPPIMPWSHDVFLSFRGEDTRKNFADHLYTALHQEGILTYKDHETLPHGDSIRPSIFKALMEPRIHVIIFSQNYVESSWCLDELAYIMKCVEDRSQNVVPIFYHVDLCELKNPSGRYAQELLLRYK
ncbi:TMV resistance protein N-like protein [Tanacetum coccineum]